MNRSSTSQCVLAAATTFELVLAVSLVAVFSSAYAEAFGTAAPRGAATQHNAALYNVCTSALALVLWCVRVGIRGRGLDVYGAVAANAMYDVLLALLWTYSAVLQHAGDAVDRTSFGLAVVAG